MLLLSLLSSCFTLVSASVHCSSLVPPYAVPPVESCDAAIFALEQADAHCGARNVIFSPTATGTQVFHLPAVYTGSQAPASDLICVIYILWQPKPGAQRPSALLDLFPVNKILVAAYSIRDHCLRPSEQYHPRLGRAWIEPHNWVDVQFGSILGPRGLAMNAGNVGSGNLTVRLADGSNQTVTSSMLRQIGNCGAASGLEDGMGANILETS